MLFHFPAAVHPENCSTHKFPQSSFFYLLSVHPYIPLQILLLPALLLVGMLIFISPLILKMVGRMPEQSLFADHIFDMERILDKGGDLTFFAIYACAVLFMSLLCLFLAWKRFQVDR